MINLVFKNDYAQIPKSNGPREPSGTQSSSCGEEGSMDRVSPLSYFKWALCCKYHNVVAQKNQANNTKDNWRVIWVFIGPFQGC